MRKTIILILIGVIAITTIIYFLFKNDKLVILALGDAVAKGVNSKGSESYNYTDYVVEYLESKNKVDTYYREFLDNDQRISDLINSIKTNEEKTINDKKISIQQALAKSDIVTLSIGTYDIYNHLGLTNGGSPVKNQSELNNYFLSLFKDINELLETIKLYTKAEVVVVGYYNFQIAPTEEVINIFDYLDTSYKKLVDKNNLNYISINKELSGNSYYIDTPNATHFNYKAHELISKKIIKVLDL